jgi:hypothetical protein
MRWNQSCLQEFNLVLTWCIFLVAGQRRFWLSENGWGNVAPRSGIAPFQYDDWDRGSQPAVLRRRPMDLAVAVWQAACSLVSGHVAMSVESFLLAKVADLMIPTLLVLI